MTAATGMDALTHNLESYLSTVYHPICDGIALAGVKLVAQNLRRAVENGSDLEARGAMMMAAMMGAIAFQKELGVNHSLAHPLSTIADLHHGLANAILLPYTMAFNKEAATDQLRDIAASIWREYPRAITGGSRTSRNRSGRAVMQGYWHPVTFAGGKCEVRDDSSPRGAGNGGSVPPDQSPPLRGG